MTPIVKEKAHLSGGRQERRDAERRVTAAIENTVQLVERRFNALLRENAILRDQLAQFGAALTEVRTIATRLHLPRVPGRHSPALDRDDLTERGGDEAEASRPSRGELLRALQEEASVRGAARRLKKDPKQIRRWMRRYVITAAEARPPRRATGPAKRRRAPRRSPG